MQTNLEGKVAIVTGGARGIGRSYAEALAAEGAAVLIADLLEAEGEQTAKAIESDGGRARFQRVDVTDPASTESMAATAAAEFGGVDILINNAAMFATLTGGMFSDIDPDRWDRTMAVNVKGPFLCIKAVVPHMPRSRWRRHRQPGVDRRLRDDGHARLRNVEDRADRPHQERGVGARPRPHPRATPSHPAAWRPRRTR